MHPSHYSQIVSWLFAYPNKTFVIYGFFGEKPIHNVLFTFNSHQNAHWVLYINALNKLLSQQREALTFSAQSYPCPSGADCLSGGLSLLADRWAIDEQI